MKKFLVVGISFLLLANFAIAQSSQLLLRSGASGPFVDHKVVPKESFFSIGRLYNVHPKSIAAFNKLDMTKGLSIGQQIHIPLTDTNFTQKGNSGAPVYYKVGDKEGLMKVSAASQNVSLSNIRQWNNLTSDVLKPGTNLVVGFIVSKELPSVTVGKNTPVRQVEQPVVKTEEVKKPEPVVAVTETAKIGEAKPKEEPTESVSPVTETPTGESTGFFKSYFEQQLKNKPLSKDATVTSGIFKTTSGWIDAKYYLLMDGVQPGVIIRITNPANNKSVYAKVLGEMAGIRQNEGLNIRISSAAASVLQVTEEDKFIVKVSY